MIKKTTSFAVLVYGALIGGLGVWGYMEAASKMSLYSGVGFGAILILCSVFMFAGKKAGSYAALATTLALTAVFSIRYSTTAKQIPAILAVLSAAMLIFLLVRVVHWKK